MSVEEIRYKGYRLVVEPYGSGWRVLIWPSGSTSAHDEILNIANRDLKQDLTAQAKKIVDQLIENAQKRDKEN
jgi:hypothetical protein